MRDQRRTPLAVEQIESFHCSAALRQQLVRRSRLFADLSPAEAAAVSELFREHGYRQGQWIYVAGEPAERLAIIAAGKVKVIRPTPEGRDVLLDVVTPGEFLGSLAVLGDATYHESAQAQTACCILSVTADAFQTVLRRYPPVALAALELVAARLRAAQDTVERQGIASARRVAATLLRLAERLGEPRQDGLLINMPLSRQDLADMSGITVETASRVMSKFRQDGLVQSGRRWVAIVNRAALAQVAHEHKA
jgi:CRP-like cAMP-binding protein